MKEKKGELIHLEMCVGFVDHLDNCESFESLIYLKTCLKIIVSSWYVRKSLHFVSRFTSILRLEGSQLRLVNNIPLLFVYLSQSKKKWWGFSHGVPQLQEAFDKILTLHQS